MTPGLSRDVVHVAMPRGPWAMDRAALQQLPAQLALRLAQLHTSPQTIRAEVSAAARRTIAQMPIAGVGVIPVRGPITFRFDFWTWLMDGTATEQIRPALRQLLADTTVDTIVLDIDSPGGVVCDVPELADEIFAARSKKRLIAACNPMAASAALWIGGACHEVVVPASGFVGSVGCYVMHEDLSAMLERIGVRVTFVQHGDRKTEGNSFEPLSETAQANIQASVDYFGGWFEKALAKYYGISEEKVRRTFGQGRVLTAPEALRVGMVKRIETLDKVMTSLPARRSRSTPALQRDQDLVNMALALTVGAPDVPAARGVDRELQDAIDLTLALTEAR